MSGIWLCSLTLETVLSKDFIRDPAAAKQIPPGSQGTDPRPVRHLPTDKGSWHHHTEALPHHRLALLGGGDKNPECLFVSCLIIPKARNLPYFFHQHEESRSSSEQGKRLWSRHLVQ